jgi:hypothetical protein
MRRSLQYIFVVSYIELAGKYGCKRQFHVQYQRFQLDVSIRDRVYATYCTVTS